VVSDRQTTMIRRAVLTLLALSPVAVACGDDSAADSAADSQSPPAPASDVPPIDHPAGAADVVLRVAYEGGFVPYGVAFAALPSLVITGDGTAITQAPVPEIYPGPLMSPLNALSLTKDGLQAVLRRADELGLLAPPRDYTTEVNVADVPDTVVTISTGGSTYEHRAYALGIDRQESTVARQDLLDFVAATGDLPSLAGVDEVGTEQPHEPTSVRMQAEVVDPATLTGMEVEPTFVHWSGGADVALADAAPCALSSAPDVIAVLTEARQTTYFVQDGRTYTVVAAPVLPGDPGC
jgi:hypothetical protein